MSRIIISLPNSLLKEFDEFVDKNQYNRSECVRHAMRLLIKIEGEKNNVQNSESVRQEHSTNS